VTDPQAPAAQPETSRPASPLQNRPGRPTRPIALLLLVALVTTGVVFVVARGGSSGATGIAKGQVVPNITGTTLDGKAFDLEALRGHPVLINFWGPSCIPCREETPLLATLVARHAADGFVVVGVLTDDPIVPARQFAAQYGGTWPTVIDPGGVLKSAYHVVGRPQSFYVDRNGIYRDIQIGQVTDADFERKYASIAGGG
jgi:cytochrome c biogenesis protein CcmG, thiol:disulfide interchange protein DsbE